MRISVVTKYLALLLIFSLVFTQINAQIRLAAYGGMHSANVIEKNNIAGWDTSVSKNYSQRTGFHLGVLLEIPIGNKGFYFQPGIGYSSKGRQYEKAYDTINGSTKDTVYYKNILKLGYVELPLYLTYKIPLSANHKNSFFISAGPYFSFFYNGTLSQESRTRVYGTSKFQYQTEDVDLPVGNAVGKYKTFDMGVNAKAGFEFGNVMISGYYSRGLTNFYHASYDGTFNHQIYGATLGIWLTKTSKAPPKASKDSDKDGIPDNEDACPLKPGDAEWRGCPPPDTDHDGVDDNHDSCRTVVGLASNHGCPIKDTDNDGVDDEHDFCKTVPGIAKYHGCPIPDTDGDGINDEVDKCPNEPGPAENQGCPVIKKQITEKVNYTARQVMFKSSSRLLVKSSYAALNNLISTLKSHPELHLTIEGHTDNTGSAAHNMTLSDQRANAVKSYLVKKGISPDRITAIGYGQEKPISDNNTNKGKSANRRVEFKLDYQQ
ncbi:MAG: OmpA family protein [Bacteroidetes bacterium]|nr:OmpA family protein [Bacteroidota bacterium]